MIYLAICNTTVPWLKKNQASVVSETTLSKRNAFYKEIVKNINSKIIFCHPFSFPKSLRLPHENAKFSGVLCMDKPWVLALKNSVSYYVCPEAYIKK